MDLGRGDVHQPKSRIPVGPLIAKNIPRHQHSTLIRSVQRVKISFKIVVDNLIKAHGLTQGIPKNGSIKSTKCIV